MHFVWEADSNALHFGSPFVACTNEKGWLRGLRVNCLLRPLPARDCNGIRGLEMRRLFVELTLARTIKLLYYAQCSFPHRKTRCKLDSLIVQLEKSIVRNTQYTFNV